MRKAFLCVMCLILAIVAISSCTSTQTYAEQKEYERTRISDFVKKNGINVIDESTFASQGYTTDTSKNQYVLFSTKGIYMQIVNNGSGSKIKDGENTDVDVRFREWNINGDSLQLRSDSSFAYAAIPDVMTVRNTSGTFSASFKQGMMYDMYGSSVPSAWLIPLTYVNLGRPDNENFHDAVVKLIVPHDQGQQYATSYVYACHYILSMRRGY